MKPKFFYNQLDFVTKMFRRHSSCTLRKLKATNSQAVQLLTGSPSGKAWTEREKLFIQLFKCFPRKGEDSFQSAGSLTQKAEGKYLLTRIFKALFKNCNHENLFQQDFIFNNDSNLSILVNDQQIHAKEHIYTVTSEMKESAATATRFRIFLKPRTSKEEVKWTPLGFSDLKFEAFKQSK